MAFSYRNTYTDVSNLTTYNFASSDIGTPGTDRLVVIATSCTAGAGRTVSSVTIDGISATLAITSTSGTQNNEIWYAAVTTANSTGTISITWSGSCTDCIVHVWVGYPASTTPVDAVGVTASSGTTRTLSNLAKNVDGFTVTAGRYNAGSSSTTTQNGAETVTENYDAVTFGSVGFSAASHVNTATTTTDDYTLTITDSAGSFVGATWGAPAVGPISGSTTLTFSTSGTLLGAGALSASSTITFTTAGILKGAGALSAATTLTFTTAGVLVGSAACSGSSSITFSTSGTLLGAGALVGATTITFSPSGVLAGIAYGSGSTSLTFTLSGTLDALPSYVWQNADGLIIVLGGRDGRARPAVIHPADGEPIGKLIYDRPRQKYRKLI